MKASELRIGNYVSSPLSSALHGLWQIRDGQSIMDVDIHERMYEPIPLTEEWLLKFGFLAPVGEYEGFNLSGGYMSMSVFLLERNEIYAMDGSDSLLVKGIRYVHQLQNLYFALTGEELTIKE